MAFPPDHLMRDEHRPCRNTCCFPRDVCRYGNSYSPDVVRWQSLLSLKCQRDWCLSAETRADIVLFTGSAGAGRQPSIIVGCSLLQTSLPYIFHLCMFCIGIIAEKSKQPTVLLFKTQIVLMDNVQCLADTRTNNQFTCQNYFRFIASTKRRHVVVVSVFMRYLPHTMFAK